MEQVEFDIAAAADEQMLALGVRPARPHAAADDRRIDVEKRLADRACEGEITRRVAASQMVVENAAEPTPLAAMGKIKIAVAPVFEARIIIGIESVAGGAEAVMEQRRVGFCGGAFGCRRGDIGAAGEPPLGGDDQAGVHMHRRHVRVPHMGDEADAARPEAPVLGRARNLRREIGAEFAPNGGDVHPHLLEDAPAHDPHFAAAAPVVAPVVARSGAAFLRAAPGCGLEAAGRGIGAIVLVLDGLEGSADSRAQRLEPGAGGLLQGVMGKHLDHAAALWRRRRLLSMAMAMGGGGVRNHRVTLRAGVDGRSIRGSVAVAHGRA